MPDANPRIPFRLEDATAPLPPYQGRRVIVHVAVNVEHWPFDQPMPRAVLPPPHGIRAVPDVPNFTWVEYGLRVGMPRLLQMCRALGIRASNLSNAQICTHYPALAEAMLAADWEFVGHGLFQKALATIENDAEVLKRNGIDFLHDWLVDDVPVWMRTDEGPLLSLPYTAELNDVPIYVIGQHASEEMARRIRDSMAFFARGGFDRTRIMTIALHPHVIGVAHRMEPFWAVMEELAQHPEVVFATSSEMGDWFTAQHPAP